jgi:hypothetical protein
MNNIELHLYLRLDRRRKSRCDVRVNTSQREQYRGYCSPIYRHGAQPSQNYIYVLDNKLQT